MKLAILLYDSVDLVEFFVPYEVLSRTPEVEVIPVGVVRGPVHDYRRAIEFRVESTLADVQHPEVLLIPGGIGVFSLMEDRRFAQWIRIAHMSSQWTASIGIGSLLLAWSGVLNGVDAATHWAFQDDLARLGAIPVPERVVQRGRIITAAGSTASMDMALLLAQYISDPTTAEAVQLWMEYDPAPPFDSGSLRKADERIITRATELLLSRRENRNVAYPNPDGPVRDVSQQPVDER